MKGHKILVAIFALDYDHPLIIPYKCLFFGVNVSNILRLSWKKLVQDRLKTLMSLVTIFGRQSFHF